MNTTETTTQPAASAPAQDPRCAVCIARNTKKCRHGPRKFVPFQSKLITEGQPTRNRPVRPNSLKFESVKGYEPPPPRKTMDLDQITIIPGTGSTDKLLFTFRQFPHPLHPADGPLMMGVEVLRGTGKAYCTRYFPGVKINS